MAANPRIVVIGAGPTGLGAGYRLAELGYDDWVILEANDYVGGLATSFTDDAGFTYDIGGHVMFSHYDYYDRLVDKLMGDEFTDPGARGVGLDGAAASSPTRSRTTSAASSRRPSTSASPAPSGEVRADREQRRRTSASGCRPPWARASPSTS